MRLRLPLYCVILSLAWITIPHALAELTLAENQRSGYTILIPQDAPTSVVNAANELQTCIEIAARAKLSIQRDETSPEGAFISLGATSQALAAGLSSEKMVDESFRILSKEGNLFILGPDTPDKGWTKKNGESHGTANGVYTFLEDYLDVRWLMPGAIGRDLPEQTILKIPEIDQSVTPTFSWRRVTHIWDYATNPQLRNTQTWSAHQKLGGSVNLDYNHNWWPTLNKGVKPRGNSSDTPAIREIYNKHPEWFAMNAEGKRPFPDSKYGKLETTNQELVRWFADRAIETLKASDRPRTFSLSPSDGRRWSQSPESKALYDPSPSTLFDPEAPEGEPGMSSLVLKWYHDIAKIVEEEYPEGRLAGYIYASYVYPPTKVEMKLPNNFTPVICGIGTYGYGLYRPDNQERWKWVMDSWTKVAPEDWYYYDLPNQLLRQLEVEVGEENFPGSTGVITPAAPDILDTIFPQLLKSHIKGAYIYGVPSWSNAALGNYLLAKLEWDPTLNAEEVQKEWLHRAYGSKAGAVMEEFYEKLNTWFRTYYQENTGLSYKLSRQMLKDIYAANYSEMESLLLRAKAQEMSEAQGQRLQLLVDNLTVLQWRLRNLGYLPAKLDSALRCSESEINAILSRSHDDFALFPGATSVEGTSWDRPKPLPWKVAVSEQAPESTPEKASIPNLPGNVFLIHALRDGEIRIRTKLVNHGAYFAGYHLRGGVKGTSLAHGIFHREEPIVIEAEAGTTYTLTIPPRQGINYQLLVEGAAVAQARWQKDTLLLSGPSAPAYVFHQSQKSGVGIFSHDDGVIIQNPASENLVGRVIGPTHENVRVLHNFDEGWKFSPDPDNDGEKRGVLEKDFDDSDWAEITGLDSWQRQGFPDYYGTAWYRLKFQSEGLPKGDRARLYFGAIDGHYTIYLNGRKVKEHTLDKDFTGWDSRFSNSVSGDILKGENLLVVQVRSKDRIGSSGIFKGAAIVAGTPLPKAKAE